jgi:Zn-dependent protease with chaperone function
MMRIDFDFARYIATRKGEVQQRARDGAAYSYVGERKVRRALVSAKPVIIALEGTTRLWKSAAKGELLGTSVRATDLQHPGVYNATIEAAKVLGITPPDVYVTPASSSIDARTLGTNDDAYIVINAGLLETLTERELVATIGHELAHIQNNHVLYTTALHYLRHSAVFFVRWVVQPAIIALQAWSRRAEISCDRAALICTQDLPATLSAMAKLSLGVTESFDLDNYIKDVESGNLDADGLGKYSELFRSHPYLPKRIKALRLFAESRFYRKLTGQDASTAAGAEDVDEQVGEILSVF